MNGSTVKYKESTQKGWQITYKNGTSGYNQIFLPYTGGYMSGTSLLTGTSTGYYWTSDINSTGKANAISMYMPTNLSDVRRFYSDRRFGLLIRPVKETGSHDAVKIGDLYWATENIGAYSPEESGKYFAWGDVGGQYAATAGAGAFTTAYSLANRPEPTLTSGTLIPDYDAAHVNWGGDWRMPTQAEITDLINSTDCQPVTNYNDTGVNGYLLTSKTDDTKSIFFPNTGYGENQKLNTTTCGYYWSATINSGNEGNAYRLTFGENPVVGSNSRYWGRCIRPVHD